VKRLRNDVEMEHVFKWTMSENIGVIASKAMLVSTANLRVRLLTSFPKNCEDGVK
jgi:hypothetical protein